jgi:hypothetical protein
MPMYAAEPVSTLEFDICILLHILYAKRELCILNPIVVDEFSSEVAIVGRNALEMRLMSQCLRVDNTFCCSIFCASVEIAWIADPRTRNIQLFMVEAICT